MEEGHLKEAAAVAQMAVGWSAYLHGIGYDVDQFRRELEQAAEHIRAQEGKQAAKKAA